MTNDNLLPLKGIYFHNFFSSTTCFLDTILCTQSSLFLIYCSKCFVICSLSAVCICEIVFVYKNVYNPKILLKKIFGQSTVGNNYKEKSHLPILKL